MPEVYSNKLHDNKVIKTLEKMTSRQNLKYVFLSFDKYPPFRVDVSVLFGKEMIKRGHNIEYVLQSEKDCLRGYRSNWNGSVVHVGRMNNGISFINRIKKNIFGILHDFKAAILLYTHQHEGILVKDKFLSGALCIIFAKILRRKTIFWLSYPYPESDLHTVKMKLVNYPLVYLIRCYVFYMLLYRVIIPFSDHVFVQSVQMKKDLLKNVMRPQKMTPVPMCVQLKDFSNIDESLVLDNDISSKIVYLGTLAKLRRIDFLLRVLKRVLGKKSDTKLYLVGDGDNIEDTEFLKSEAKNLGVSDSVIITGFLNRDKALIYVKSADVCVSPFYPTPILNSTSPTKLVEYMAMKKAVVANDHPEQRLVIKESQAGICVPYKEEDFSKAILYILENPKIAKKMGERGRLYVEKNRTYSVIADQVDNKMRKFWFRQPF
jgi:glycosyltransferase involved in cell wall biosynthesis